MPDGIILLFLTLPKSVSYFGAAPKDQKVSIITLSEVGWGS